VPEIIVGNIVPQNVLNVDPPENVTPYAKRAFRALFEAHLDVWPERSLSQFMSAGLQLALTREDRTLRGVYVTRLKKLCRDIVLENPNLFLFAPQKREHGDIAWLLHSIQSEEPPATESRSASCRSRWYAEGVEGLFASLPLAQAAQLFDAWGNAYLRGIASETDRNYLHRFHEIFDHIGRLYRLRTTLRTLARKPGAEQLSFPVTERNVPPSEEPDVGTLALALGPPSRNGITVEMPLLDAMVPETRPVRVIRVDTHPVDDEGGFTVEQDFMDMDQDAPFERFLSDGGLDALAGPVRIIMNPHDVNWADYVSIATRQPSVAILDDKLVMASAVYVDSGGFRTFHTARVNVPQPDGTIQEIEQRDLETIIGVEALNPPNTTCFVNYTPLRAGLCGKSRKGQPGVPDDPKFRTFWVVTKASRTREGYTPLYTNRELTLWAVSEEIYYNFLAFVRRRTSMRI
jgi:hypothetical protein